MSSSPNRRVLAGAFSGAGLVVGLIAGYFLWAGTGSSTALAPRPSFFGVGTEIVERPRDHDGVAFDLTSTFAFTSDSFHCVVATNDRPFPMRTYALGTVHVPKNQFFMALDSVRIERVASAAGGRVEITGLVRSRTRIGSSYEDAVVPFFAVAIDGGPGPQNDLLLFTVFYNHADSPLQLAHFGPGATFGQAEGVIAGDIVTHARGKPPTQVARKWMEYAIAIVREKKPPPTTAARFYAYVAAVYSKVLNKTRDALQASVATAEIIDTLHPSHKARTRQLLQSVGAAGTQAAPDANAILAAYRLRNDTDNFRLAWDNAVPAEEDKWFIRAVEPVTPLADRWKRWIVDTDRNFSVPDPPPVGSAADQLEVEKVIAATTHRTLDELASIAFWAGAPGSETPAGIWQNRLFEEVGERLNDREYATAQKLLAQSIADAFIITWDVKYRYWTQRPSMRIPHLNLALPDPNFPGYVSGHSTISKTAAEVLSHLFPDKRDVWQRNATDAKNSRLSAGIHFDVDNRAGEDLGKAIGMEILARLASSRKPSLGAGPASASVERLQPDVPSTLSSPTLRTSRGRS